MIGAAVVAVDTEIGDVEILANRDELLAHRVAQGAQDLRRKRHYVKPSEARQQKAAAARRRKRSRGWVIPVTIASFG